MRCHWPSDWFMMHIGSVQSRRHKLHRWFTSDLFTWWPVGQIWPLNNRHIVSRLISQFISYSAVKKYLPPYRFLLFSLFCHTYMFHVIKQILLSDKENTKAVFKWWVHLLREKIFPNQPDLIWKSNCPPLLNQELSVIYYIFWKAESNFTEAWLLTDL